jgi:hypothetical protein
MFFTLKQFPLQIQQIQSVCNRARPFHPFWQKSADWLNWLCPVTPVRSVLKRTAVQDFYSFSIIFYDIINTTYQKIGDLLPCSYFWTFAQCSVPKTFLPKKVPFTIQLSYHFRVIRALSYFFEVSGSD